MLRQSRGVKKHLVELYVGRLIMVQFKQVLNLKLRYCLRTIVLKKLVPGKVRKINTKSLL